MSWARIVSPAAIARRRTGRLAVAKTRPWTVARWAPAWLPPACSVAVERPVERQRDREVAAAEIDLVAGAHAFEDERAAQGRDDFGLIEGLAHALDQHAVEPGLRTPGKPVGARNRHELLDLDRGAAARGRRAEDGAVARHTVEHDQIAFDDDHVGAQALRRGRRGSRDDRGDDEDEEEGEGLHGRSPERGTISGAG
jgi:hypothetical protein